MTGRTRSRGSRAPSRRPAGSISPSSRRVTRQQNVNIDPNLSGEAAMPPPQGMYTFDNVDRDCEANYLSARRSTRHAASASGTDGGYEPQNDYATPAPSRMILTSIEEQGTPSQRIAKTRLMRKFLDRLFTSTDDIFTHMLSARDETWQDELDGLNDVTATFRKHYVADLEAPFLDPVFVLAKLQAEPNSALWVAATKTVSAVNLTQLLDQLLNIQQGHHEHEDLLADLMNWDSTFPTAFVPDKELVSPDDTFDHALDIRTQVFIATLQSHYSQDLPPDGVDHMTELANVFGAKDTSPEQLQAIIENEDVPVELREITGFDISLETENRARLVSRLRGIYNNYETLDGLQNTFPLKEFAKNFQIYVQNAYARIKEVLQLQGAIPQVPAIFGAAAQSPIASQLESDAALARPPYDPNFQGAAPPSAQPVSNYPPPENPYSTQGSGPMYAEAVAAAAVAAGQKRPAPDDGDEEAFETDTRAPQKKRRAPGKPRAKRSRKNQASEAGADLTSGDYAAPMAQMDLSYDPANPQMEPDLEALTQRSREVGAANRKPKEPQTRTPWSQQDARLLIKLVDYFKCKWSKIAAEIEAGRVPFQHPRNQQALRDKARIMKQDYLRTDGLLPASFDLVVLGKKEIENVRSVGRNPFRKEADVLDGRPVNTLLLPPEALGQELVQPEPELIQQVQQEPLELLQQEEQLPVQPVPIQQDSEVQPDVVQPDAEALAA